MAVNARKPWRWLTPFWTAVSVAGVGGLVFLTVILAHPYSTGPAQPLPFSHRIHAGNRDISCVFCHNTVDHSTNAGMPPVQKCLLCHNIIIRDLPPIQQLHRYANTNTPVPWVRVYKLPDFVRFTHDMHIAAGHDCGECHGNVKQMDRIVQAMPMQMGFCVDCHRKNAAPTDCWNCHY